VPVAEQQELGNYFMKGAKENLDEHGRKHQVCVKTKFLENIVKLS